MADEDNREERNQDNQKERSPYTSLIGELAWLQRELQKRVASPSLIDFAHGQEAERDEKLQGADAAVEKTSVLTEVGYELKTFLWEVVERLTHVEGSEKAYEAMASTLTPELVDLLTDIKERAYVYLANKNRQEIAGQIVSTIQGRETQFAGSSWIVGGILSRAGRWLGPKLEMEEKRV